MKKIYSPEDAREKLKAGVDALANIVKSTMGPKGKNVIIHRGFGNPVITKDGVTVAREVEVADPVEMIGVEMARVASSKTNDDVGDGTTTAAVLIQALLEGGMKAIEEDPTLDVHAMREGMEEMCVKIVEGLEEMKVDITEDKEKILHIATISANNDPALGKLIADLFSEIGKDGTVSVEEHQGTEVETERVEGMRFEKGFVSPYMVTDEEKDLSIVENAHILVTDRKITDPQELIPIMQKVSDGGKKELVVICDALEGEALPFVVVNRVRAGYLTLAIKAPGFGDRKEDMIRDICAVTGAKFISVDLDDKLEDVTLEDLGCAKRVEAGRDHTIIVGGQGDATEIEARKENLRLKIAEQKSGFEKTKLEERLAKLAGGVSIIRAGGKTEGEMREKKYLIDDAVSAVRAALQGGVVPGGGAALLRVSTTVNKGDGIGEESTGHDIVEHACEAPFNQILKNAHAPDVMKEMLAVASGQIGGYDAKKMEYVEDMFLAGIIDPFLVTKNALENAVSVAGLILTTDGVIAEVPSDELKK